MFLDSSLDIWAICSLNINGLPAKTYTVCLESFQCCQYFLESRCFTILMHGKKNKMRENIDRSPEFSPNFWKLSLVCVCGGGLMLQRSNSCFDHWISFRVTLWQKKMPFCKVVILIPTFVQALLLDSYINVLCNVKGLLLSRCQQLFLKLAVVIRSTPTLLFPKLIRGSLGIHGNQPEEQWNWTIIGSKFARGGWNHHTPYTTMPCHAPSIWNLST